jgi:arylsulfatase A-like enzyme/predicted GH43/DUF377 family glycosyl hydrolase
MKALLLLLPLILPLAAPAPAAPQPNILFAIADDWGCHAGVYGTPWVKTPAFDRIANQGLLFNNAYTPMAKCAPSRAIVLTGRQLWQLEEAGNHLAVFPPKFKSWPEALKEKGWHVGLTGKGWGPGTAKDATGKPRQITGQPYQKRKAPPPASGMFNIDYAANFTDFLDAAPQNSPWCFWYGPLEPHRGYEYQSGATKGGKKPADIDRVPAYWPDTEAVRHDLLDYALEVEHADMHLGRMIAELEKRGQLDNTVIIVTSDHGMPFPRVKGYAYHDSNHIPLAIRWPGGMKKPGRIIDDFVDFSDIAATVLDLAGIPQAESGMQPLTGTSWRPILESDQAGQVIAARDHTLIGKERTDVGRPHNWGYPIRGIVTASHLYLKNHEPSRWPAGNPETGYLDTDGSPTKSLILDLGRKDRADRFWQLNFGLRPGEEFYDLRSDPDCVHNLAADPALQPRLQALRERMEAALKAQGDPRMAGQGHVFDDYKPTAGDGFYEKFMRGEKPEAGWVNASDFEPRPLANPAAVPAASKRPAPEAGSRAENGSMMFADTTRIGRPFSKDPSVIRFGGRYLMYFSLPPFSPERAPANAPRGWSIGIAESSDLTTWKKIGELLPEQECDKNGLCAPGARILDGKVHLFYQTYGNGPKDAICHAVSADGLHFQRDATNPVFRPTGGWNNGRAIDAEVIPFGDRLLLYFATRDPAGKIQMVGVAAADLKSNYGREAWRQLADHPVLKPELPWEKQCIEAPSIVQRGDELLMFYAGGYNNDPQQVGVASSRDGVVWKRLSDTPLLPNGAPGEWNSSESGHPGIFTDADGSTHLFFQGNPDKGRTWWLSRVAIGWTQNRPRVMQ